MLKSGVDILVATPGRLNDLIGQGIIKLGGIEIFVLDEADRMLDMGFIHDVRRVLEKLPAKRQTLMFSATMPPEIEKLADGMLVKPKTVKVDPVTSTVEAIDQRLYYVDKGNKKYLLAQILKSPEVHSALVFTRTKHGADKVVRELDREGIEAMAIHGNKSQRARQTALNSFKDGKIWVLVATDIAARGIDIMELSHVINYDIPNEPETYIHRIGRTGRAGRGGSAVSFCCIDEVPFLKDIEKLTGEKIPVAESDWPMLMRTPTAPHIVPQTAKARRSRPCAAKGAEFA
jgi:ATP-dependent RNA helicase RhlE